MEKSSPIYVQFGAFLLRNDLAQLPVLLPHNLSNVVIKLQGVRFPDEAELLLSNNLSMSDVANIGILNLIISSL